MSTEMLTKKAEVKPTTKKKSKFPSAYTEMAKKKTEVKTTAKRRKFPSAYTILIALMIIIAIVTNIVPGVKPAALSDLVMAPVTGFTGIKDLDIDDAVVAARESGGVEAALQAINDAEGPYINVWNNGELVGGIGVALFVLFIGGCIGVVKKTGALEAGVGHLVKKLKGKEIILIPILMFIFSIGGTTYGMAEETLAFYALLVATMLAAGFDPIVGAATVMVGAGAGVLGSTVNPFATGVAIASAESSGVTMNKGYIMAIGAVLWLTSIAICIFYVMRYAKKVKATNRASSVLTAVEMQEAEEAYGNGSSDVMPEYTGRRKAIVTIFLLSFVVMIMSLIPWNDFGVTIFDNTTHLMGSPLGWWYFPEITVWFLLIAIVIGIVGRLSEKDFWNSFVSGAADMMSVALVIGIARGVSLMMTNTGLDLLILDKACGALNGVSGPVFANLAYIIYIGLSFLIPSTSGLATVSMPIFAPLAKNLGIAPEIMVGAFIAGEGIVNFIAPTSGVVMGGLAISKIEYSTWLKFMGKLLLMVFIANVIVLSIVALVL